MTTLITGAGQVGAHVAQILIEDGQEPILFDVNAPLDFVKTLVPAAHLRLTQGDLRDLGALVDVIRQHDVECIIHTAAILPPKSEDDARLCTQVNVEGTANVLEAARLMGVKRVVFCSTIGVYDMRAVSGETMCEDDPVRPDLVYSASKVYGEQLGENYARRRGVEFVALRFAHIFGPGPLPVRPGLGAMVGELVSACMRGGRSVVRPRTLAAKEYLYIVDAARAAVMAVSAPSVTDRVFNIGMGRVYGPREMARIASQMAEGVEIEIKDVETSGEARSIDMSGRPFDLTRARQQLGYAPAYDLEAAMRHHMAYLTAVR